MGSLRALIIGSDKDYCYVIKEFLDSRGLISALVLDYNQGIDKLFYENPDVTVIELISSHKVSPNLINKVRNSGDLQQIDFANDSSVEIDKDLKPVFFLEETSQLNTLLAYLNTFFISGLERGDSQKSEPVIDIKKDLESFPYPILLSYLHRNSMSGVLSIQSSVNLKLYLLEGLPVYAEGGDVETALGRMLIESGKIGDVKDYEKALNIANEKKQKLGEVLVSLGVISPHELNELLENQIAEKIIKGFLLKSGAFSFESGKEKVNHIVKYEIDFPHVLHEGTKRYGDNSFIRNIFFDHGEVKKIKVIKDIGQKTDALGLGPKELRIIQNLEKNTNIDKILNKSTTSDEETLKILFLIYLLGYIVFNNDIYRNLGKFFNQTEEDQAKDIINQNKYEDIIDLDDEITHSTDQPRVESETKKELSDKEKEMINAVSRMELEMEIDAPIIQKSSNVIPFKEQQVRVENEIQAPNITIADEPAESNIDDKPKTKYTSALINDINNIHSRLDEEDYYMILGVDRTATKQQIKDSYYALVKKYHPDILATLDHDIRNKADQIFSVISTAYQTLSDDDKRAEYDSEDELDSLKSEAEQLYKAEIFYNEGTALLKQKKYEEAEEKFIKASEINSDSFLYKGIIKWAIFLKNRDDKDNVNKCITVLEKLTSENTQVAANYYYLGSIYKHRDELKKAELNFTKAVENDSDYIDAKRELRVIQNRITEKRDSKKTKTEKRFWSSLFKK